MTDRPIILLFRQDLRLRDNGALAEAARSGRPIIAVFILDDESDGTRPRGAASNWWLHHSLKALSAKLDHLGCRLILRQGSPLQIVSDLIDTSRANAVLWNRRYNPRAIIADDRLAHVMRAKGVFAQSFDGDLLHEPSKLKTGAGSFYKVFKPFWNRLSSEAEPRGPIDAPTSLRAYSGKLPTDRLEDIIPLPQRDWTCGLAHTWTPGEAGATAALDMFIAEGLEEYAVGRDLPAKKTSRLSPHLAHGEITPFTIFSAVAKASDGSSGSNVAKFKREVGWREFCYHLLCHNPDLERENFLRTFDNFPWRTDGQSLKAWQRGSTGYPIVDAGMRELWQTGTMHNRVRMIAASFLTKHLLLDWREGERWFWDTLVDADSANNPGNWQWVAGSGADAAPYFRIFNPVLQGEKFDPHGEYVRAYVPELAMLPDRFVHRPWDAPADILEKAGVLLGQNYPAPIVDHAAARERALSAYRFTKQAA